MNESNNTQDFNYFLKGDISGIQEFIFNVKSEGAAKSLKGRSFFIQALSLICIKMIEDKMNQEMEGKEVKLFYNGGGNFYLMLEDFKPTFLEEIQRTIDKACHKLNFYVVLSLLNIEEIDLGKEFGEVWNDLNLQAAKDKLRKFRFHTESYTPYPTLEKRVNGKIEEIFKWKALTKFIKREKEYDIIRLDGEATELGVDEKGIRIFGYSLEKGSRYKFEDEVMQLPLWNDKLINENQQLIFEEAQRSIQSGINEYEAPRVGGIIEFAYLAGFSKLRTGTKKIGILKMDVDNLGTIFGLLPSQNAANYLSNQISSFFGKELKILLESPIQNDVNSFGAATYGQNLYTVFAGGDDCFFVGGWDIIIDWASLLHKKFTELAKSIKTGIIERVPKRDFSMDLEERLPMTISAGLVMLEPTYPTIRFADLTESALEDAKYFTYPREPKRVFKKNKINLLNQVLTWEELAITTEAATLLTQLVVHKNEPRSIIEKIRSSATEFEGMYKQASQSTIQGPSVSKLFYFVRKSNNQAIIAQAIITPFAKDLINVFAKGIQANPLKYPLAARLAEFYTRKQQYSKAKQI